MTWWLSAPGAGLLKAPRLGSTAEWLMHENGGPDGVRAGASHATHRAGPRRFGWMRERLRTRCCRCRGSVLQRFSWYRSRPPDPGRSCDRGGGGPHARSRRCGPCEGAGPTDLEVFYRPSRPHPERPPGLERGSDRDGQSRRERMESANEVGLRRAGSNASAIAHHALLSAARQGVAVKERPRHDLPPTQASSPVRDWHAQSVATCVADLGTDAEAGLALDDTRAGARSTAATNYRRRRVDHVCADWAPVHQSPIVVLLVAGGVTLLGHYGTQPSSSASW